jgi:hypothetical protein
MASNSETGHAKNVANLKTLNVYLASLGAKYNPTKKSITLAQLQTLHTNADQSLTAIQDAFPFFTAAVDDQEAAFKPLDKLVTRVIRAYKASVDNPAEAETAISLQKEIRVGGKKKDPKKEPAEGEADPISDSQLSYDNRQANFQLLVKTVAANPDYKPNEPELQATALQAYADDLRQKTEAVDGVATPIINGRINRNEVLYHPTTGLYPTVITAVKNYIISVFGAGSPQIRYINTLKFTGIKKKK